MNRKARDLFWLIVGLIIGACATASAATDLERSADRIAKALERIAAVADKGR